MSLETRLVEFVTRTRSADLPRHATALVKDVALNVVGAILAGASTPGCPEAVALAREWGGRPEATVLVHGGRIAACHAAFANSFVARAVGVDEAIVPGIHVGASVFPTALAVAELVGGCSGEEFLTALVVGTEVAARLNGVTQYDGRDPTGFCAGFGATATAARLMGLRPEAVHHALGHAFNRSGGSFQGTIDGTIAARVLQGQVSQGAVMSAQLAQRGVSGPTRFLEGVYGYLALYGKAGHDGTALVSGLGTRFELSQTYVKKYPSCGTTGPAIDATLAVMAESGRTADDIEEIQVVVTPTTFELTGQPFAKRADPRIDAMYNLQYCVASAVLRGPCRLRHFDAAAIDDPRLAPVMRRIHVTPDPALAARNLLATDVRARMRDGRIYEKSVDLARGMPGNPLSEEELMDKVRDCIAYGGARLAAERVEEAVGLLRRLEEVKDVRRLAELLTNDEHRLED